MTAVAPGSATLESPSSLRGGRAVDPEQRRNTWLPGIDMAIFAMGLGALGQMTLIPLFVSKLTDSPLVVGAVALAPVLGGQVVAWLGYTWLFGLSALVAMLTLGDGARAPGRTR